MNVIRSVTIALVLAVGASFGQDSDIETNKHLRVKFSGNVVTNDFSGKVQAVLFMSREMTFDVVANRRDEKSIATAESSFASERSSQSTAQTSSSVADSSMTAAQAVVMTLSSAQWSAIAHRLEISFRTDEETVHAKFSDCVQKTADASRLHAAVNSMLVMQHSVKGALLSSADVMSASARELLAQIVSQDAAFCYVLTSSKATTSVNELANALSRVCSSEKYSDIEVMRVMSEMKCAIAEAMSSSIAASSSKQVAQRSADAISDKIVVELHNAAVALSRIGIVSTPANQGEETVDTMHDVKSISHDALVSDMRAKARENAADHSLFAFGSVYWQLCREFERAKSDDERSQVLTKIIGVLESEARAKSRSLKRN